VSGPARMGQNISSHTQGLAHTIPAASSTTLQTFRRSLLESNGGILWHPVNPTASYAILWYCILWMASNGIL